jgi:putative transposase
VIKRFPSHDVPDELWQRIEPLLPKEKKKPKGGRPPVPARKVLAGVLYKLRTGCPWKALGREFGSGATCHRRFAAWCRRGVFLKFWQNMLREYDAELGAGLDWTSLDSAIVKAPKGGTKPAPIRRTEPKVAVSATC